MEETLIFSDRQAFREWLANNGAKSEGVWLLFGKTEKVGTLSASEALEEALCYGWIDGQIKSLDTDSYKKYFARRLPKSVWSVKNKGLVLELMEKKLMAEPGLAAIECAKQNGSWDNPKPAVIDDDQINMFLETIRPYDLAYSNLIAMSHSVQRTYTGFYLDAKSEKTRQNRLAKIVDRLNQNLKPM